MADSTDEDSHRCEQCTAPIGDSNERRVVTSIEDGTAVHRHFCDENCLEKWSQ
ncbi:DUF7576 family protein [Salinadaptatus halalkaliphilus]|uniref:DUF7576 family protein n=1 Tax=Salinadaptatus halalkaliphilus TaxID=2419781 RepID=UPI001580FCD8|nr:hypothetical protein [Salinadaptatus halalkaliphilus]